MYSLFCSVYGIYNILRYCVVGSYCAPPFYGLGRNGNGDSVTNAGVPHAFNKSWPQGRTGRGHGNYRAARRTAAAALGRRPCPLVVKTTLFANGVLRVVLLRGRGAKGKFRLPCRT